MYYILDLIIIQTCVVAMTYGWGREGHYITAKIAESFLNQNGRLLVDTILGPDALKLGQPFYEAAAWADQVQGDPAFAWSPPLHFINTPYRTCDGFSISRDCSTPCLISGIANFTAQVANDQLPLAQRQEALKFLIHFLADVNQPLHVAFAFDKGGNKITVTPPWDHTTDKAGKTIKAPRPKPLHVLWDSHIIQFSYVTAKLTWSQLADTLIADIRKGGSFDSLHPDPVYNAILRADDSSSLACTIAYKESGRWIAHSTKLSEVYFHDSARTSLNQLMKSGIDIAAALNSIGEQISGDTETISDIMDTGSTDEEFDDWENAFGSPDNEDELYLMYP
jgi:hypothetical protein